MDRSLIDTDIVSEILAGVHPVVRERITRYVLEVGFAETSAPTVVEIMKGLHRLPNEDRRRRFENKLREDFEVLPLDKETAELAGRIFAELERMGQTIGVIDSMITAIAIHSGLTLVTGNTALYRRIQALGYPLRLENWRE